MGLHWRHARRQVSSVVMPSMMTHCIIKTWIAPVNLTLTAQGR